VWVECSKGTYIRSLAHDLGQALGCGAFMAGLVRVQSGPFHLRDAVTLGAVEAAHQAGQLDAGILQPLDAVLADWPAWVVDAATAEKIRQGRNLAPGDLNAAIDPAAGARPFRRVYTAQGELLALLEPQGPEWHPAKVFSFTFTV
jgi:tRNA pseudouridine55 synthase